jgi:hypothetical protein
MSKSCSNFIGTLFAIVFIFAAIAAIILYQLEFRLLSPEPYVEVLQDRELQQDLVDIAANELAARFDLDPCTATPELCDRVGGPPAYLTQLSEADLKQILMLLTPPDWVSGQAELLVRGLFSLLTPEDNVATITFDIQPVKDRLRGEAGEEITALVLASLPDCTPDQITQLGELLIAGGSVDQLLICSPPPELHSLVMPVLEGQVDLLASELPAVIVLDLANTGVLAESEGILVLYQAREFLRIAFLISLFAAGGSILIALLFVVRSLRGFLFWIGWPLLTIGLLVLLITLGVRGSTGLFVRSLAFSQQVQMLQQQTLSFILDLVNAVVAHVLQGVTYLSIGITAGGALLLITSRFVPLRNQGAEIKKRSSNL